MHLAILMTNTDESAFAHRHPRDGEKFTALIHSVRPDWRLSTFSVKDGVFPDEISDFDGAIITGSPASVHDHEDWVGQLIEFLRTAIDASFPLFGACFGHQAIAMTLGVSVVENPNGWVFGRAQVEIVNRPDWARDLPDQIDQYAAHIEQISDLPAGAIPLLSSPDCPVAGFALGTHIATTQNHPEMSHEFASALVEEYAPKLPDDVAVRAKASMAQAVDGRAYAEAIARFFEAAVQRSQPAGSS